MIINPFSFADNDPFFANVISLVHFDASLVDQKGKVWTPSGTAAISGVASMFGAGSLDVPGSGNSGISSPTGTDWNFGTGDFTVELWYRRNGTPQTSARIFQSRNGDVFPGIGLAINDGINAGRVQVFMSSNGSSFDIANGVLITTLSDTLFHHLAISRQGTSIRFFVDGAAAGSATSSAAIYYNAADSIIIGGNVSSTSRSVAGYIDEFRATKGVARYTSAFTPTTVAFPNQ